MKIEPISVFAINATVTEGVTPTGKPKYTIALGYDAGTAVDRVQSCCDYKKSAVPSVFENHVFFVGPSKYISYSFNPLNNNAVYLLTCKCETSYLTKEEALMQLDRGMREAFEEMKKLYKK